MKTRSLIVSRLRGNWLNLGLLLRLTRAAISLRTPFVTRHPRQLTQQGT